MRKLIIVFALIFGAVNAEALDPKPRKPYDGHLGPARRLCEAPMITLSCTRVDIFVSCRATSDQPIAVWSWPTASAVKTWNPFISDALHIGTFVWAVVEAKNTCGAKSVAAKIVE